MSTKKRWVTSTFATTPSDEALKKRSTAVTKRSKRTTSTLAVNRDRSQTWLEKYQPETANDLVVHPKKVKELAEWFTNYLSYKSEKYLLLQGPCGCGKTTTLRVLAKQFKFVVFEWITPLDRDYNPELAGEDQNYQNTAKVFDTFLSKASRYPALFSASSHKLILVKDIPNVFHQTPEILHNLLKKFLQMSTHPVVFVCNDDQQTRNLFPEVVRKECSFRVINFNPVTDKGVAEALRRVLDVEHRCGASRNTTATLSTNLEHICHSSAGDLRAAILRLYFSASQGNSDEGEAKVHVEPAASNSSSTGDHKNKDEGIDLFKILGRVLYANRKLSASGVACGGYTFTHSPHEIVECVTMQPSSFLGFLQENYLSRFSDLEEVAAASHYLSLAEVLLTQLNKDTNVAALTVATAGLMVANNNPIKSFKPFVKPRFREDLCVANIRNEIHEAFGELRHHHSPGDIILYMLPLLSKCDYPFEGGDQKRVVSKLANVFRR